ncbi:radical SAM protein [Nanoarchaeota archaeon]
MRATRINLMASKQCNNNCIFCLEDCNISKVEGFGNLAQAKKALEIKKVSSLREILFTGKEPTLNENLVDTIASLKTKAHARISLITNGRRISYKPYLNKLVNSGLDNIMVSIHGHTHSLHDALTRSPGSFKQTKLGLKNAMNIRNKAHLGLITTTTLTKMNYQKFDKIINFLEKFKADAYIFNPVIPRGRALLHKGAVLVDYSSISKEIQKTLKKKKPGKIKVGLPSCLMGGFECFVGAREKIIKITGERKSEEKYEGRKTKSKKCKRCSYYSGCDGVHKEYISLFGWKEFKPVLK